MTGFELLALNISTPDHRQIPKKINKANSSVSLTKGYQRRDF